MGPGFMVPPLLEQVGLFAVLSPGVPHVLHRRAFPVDRPAGFRNAACQPGQHVSTALGHNRLAGTAEPVRVARPEAVGL